MNRVLDYSDYVEMTCSEEDAAYQSEPSLHDVQRNAPRFLDADDRPENPLAVSWEFSDKAHRKYVDFVTSRRLIFGPWHHISKCPYCNQTIEVVSLPPRLPQFSEVALRQCMGCGWWDTDEELHVDYPDPDDPKHYVGRSIHRRAVLKEFDVSGSEVPLLALRAHLATHPDALYHISPYRLEHLVASIFRDFMSCEAIHLGGPADGGVDLLLINGERRYVVQVKRRGTHNSTESVKNIREFVGAMVISGETRGLFVSTAAHFSRHAERAADMAQERGVIEYLELINGKRLLDICDIVAERNEPNWQRALTSEDTILDHVNTGRFEFLSHAFGSPDWKVTHDA